MKTRLLTLVLLLALAAPAFGQGCIMCYQSAQGASVKGKNALSKGVAVLLFPPLAIMGVLVGFAFRYKEKDDNSAVSEGSPAGSEL